MNDQKQEISSKEKALLCARWALEKKAYQLDILNVDALSYFTDYFVICTARSVRQTRAISDHIQAKLKKELHQRPFGVEGEKENCWILLDCDDVIVHIFFEPTRELYTLEKLWSEAVPVKDPEIVRLEEQEKAAAHSFDNFDDEEDESNWEDNDWAE